MQNRKIDRERGALSISSNRVGIISHITNIHSKTVMPIILLLILIIGSTETKAQRYIPRQKAIQITGGTVDGVYLCRDQKQSYHVGLALSQYTEKGNRWICGVEYLYKEYSYSEVTIPKAQFTLEGGHYYKLLSNGSKSLFFSFGASALVGYETSNWSDKLLYDGATLINEDSFIYGGALTFEVELFLTDWLVLLVNARERVLWGSDIGQFHTEIGTGVKFILN